MSVLYVDRYMSFPGHYLRYEKKLKGSVTVLTLWLERDLDLWVVYLGPILLEF